MLTVVNNSGRVGHQSVSPFAENMRVVVVEDNIVPVGFQPVGVVLSIFGDFVRITLRHFSSRAQYVTLVRTREIRAIDEVELSSSKAA